MKVLLIYTHQNKEAWVPIGLLYIAANLRKNNIEVKIIDNHYDNVFSSIINYGPDIIGLGDMTVNADITIQIGREIKRNFPDIILVFGGVHFTFMPDEAKDIADIIISEIASSSTAELIYEYIVFNIVGHLEYNYQIINLNV